MEIEFIKNQRFIAITLWFGRRYRGVSNWFQFFFIIRIGFFQKKTSSGMFFFVQTIFFPWKCTPTEAIINNMPLCKIWSWWDNSYDMTSNHKISFLFFIILPSMAHFENDILISHKKNLFGVFCWLRLFQLFVYNF